MSDALAAYPLWLIRRCVEHGSPVVARLLLDGPGVTLAELSEIPGQLPADAFEAWLVERTLRAARSDEFRATAEFEYLQAEWEQGH